jgi:hypothetical protein
MGWSLRLGEVAGIRVQVHFTFAIFMVWILFSGLVQGESRQAVLVWLCCAPRIGPRPDRKTLWNSHQGHHATSNWWRGASGADAGAHFNAFRSVRAIRCQCSAPVLRGGRLVGLLTAENLGEFSDDPNCSQWTKGCEFPMTRRCFNTNDENHH